MRLPKGFELPQGKVALRKEGKKIIIEEIENDWPKEFFSEIQITRPEFGREPAHYVENQHPDRYPAK